MDIIITKEFTSKSGLGGLRLLAKARINLNELTAIICEQVQDNSVGGMGSNSLGGELPPCYLSIMIDQLQYIVYIFFVKRK